MKEKETGISPADITQTENEELNFNLGANESDTINYQQETENIVDVESFNQEVDDLNDVNISESPVEENELPSKANNLKKVKSYFSKDKVKKEKGEKEKFNFKQSYGNLIDKIVSLKALDMRSLGAKLIFSITLCSAVLVIVVTTILAVAMGSLIETNYTNECHVAMKSLEQEIDNYNVDSMKFADTMAADMQLVTAMLDNDKITAARKLQEYLLSSRGDYGLVTDEKGMVIASRDSKFNNVDFSEYPAIANAIGGQSTTTIMGTKQIPFGIVTAVPVLTGTGKIKGSVLIGYSLSDDDSLDNLKLLTGNDFTIFKGDTRASTTFKVNGERQNGTQASEKVIKTVIEKGKIYEQELDLFGSKRLAIYKPLLDNDNKTIGMIFTSKDIKSILSSQAKTIWFAVIAASILFILVAFVIASVVQRIISKPLKKLVIVAEEIENGKIGIGKEDTDENIKYSRDEVGVLSKALAGTVRGLKTYIGEISTVLGEIAEGDLTVQSEIEFKGDFVAIKRALDNIVYSLKDTLTGISQAASQVSSGAEQVASGAQALSQGSTEQSSAIEQLSASIGDVSDKIKANAQNANVASSLGEQASQGVSVSNQQMQAMVEAMNDINKASNAISKIIKTIDDIAFQTNILALNAAVEAARAGAAGKGFAVVAAEVRSLAGKSAEAASQTTGLIENSINAVKKGSKIAKETAESLEVVVSKSQQVIDLVQEISSESNQQATAVSEITIGVDQISAVVQTNSATAEESAAASEELSSQSALLHDLISKFKID